MKFVLWERKRSLLSHLWLITVLSLGIWWLNLGLRQANTVAELKNALGGDIASSSLETLNRQERMIIWEGSVFIILLGIGGITLILLSHKDRNRNQLLNDFFATVSHEMKTPIASLRLQAETLAEDISNASNKKLIQRLIGDTERIEAQMDKALYLASLMRSEKLFFESASINDLFQTLKVDWPIDTKGIEKNLFAVADKRALESVFKNLIENGIKHGKASSILISAKKENDQIQITLSDNGSGFHGNLKQLGKPFYRHSTTSGTGIGLYLVKTLIRKMNGSVSFQNKQNGFQVQVTLQAAANGNKI